MHSDAVYFALKNGAQKKENDASIAVQCAMCMYVGRPYTPTQPPKQQSRRQVRAPQVHAPWFISIIHLSDTVVRRTYRRISEILFYRQLLSRGAYH